MLTDRYSRIQTPYGQFILYGDSITEGAFDQSRGFACGAQLAHGETPPG